MLKLNNIYKTYKNSDKIILNDINLTVAKGEIVGLLGKNGAGKTTLMKIIAKSKKPTSGTVYINNINIFNESNILDNVGIMIDTVYYDHLSAEKNLRYFLNVNNKTEYIKNINQVLDMVGLLSVSNKKIKHFSFGMKQRLSLAMCLIIEPKLAIMDEPFVGLDPNGVQSLILSLKKWVKIKNTSLLISSHQLNELEAVCDRFVFLKEGQLHEIQLDEFQFLKIIVDKEIENEHILLFKREFPIISKIEKNVIYIPNDARHYNALLKFVLSHYNLVHIDTPKQGLYSAFDYFERNEE